MSTAQHRPSEIVREDIRHFNDNFAFEEHTSPLSAASPARAEGAVIYHEDATHPIKINLPLSASDAEEDGAARNRRPSILILPSPRRANRRTSLTSLGPAGSLRSPIHSHSHSGSASRRRFMSDEIFPTNSKLRAGDSSASDSDGERARLTPSPSRQRRRANTLGDQLGGDPTLSERNRALNDLVTRIPPKRRNERTRTRHFQGCTSPPLP
jgi:hypothetical protein